MRRAMKPAARRILVRCPNWVGDFVMSTPILDAIRGAFPEAHITHSLRPNLLPVAQGLGSCDAFHEHPPKLRFRDVRRIAAELRKQQFDLAIIFPNSFETALTAALAGIPRRFGYAMNGRGFLLTDRLSAPASRGRRIPTPMPYYWSDLVGLAGVEVKSIKPRLVVDEAISRSVDSWLSDCGLDPSTRWMLVAPGASFGASKLWKPSGFAGVIDYLFTKHGVRSLIQFGPSEESIALDIASQCTSAPVVASSPPLDLQRLKAAVRRCDMLLCTDSGVRHYGVAMDRPVVCIMGPNDPRYTAANLEKTTVIREDVDCGPCQLKVCPLDHRCMERIEISRVAAACERALGLL